MKPARIVFLLFSMLSCATTNQSKRLELAGTGFLSGLAIGAANTPQDEKKELHAMYWGSVFGLTAAIIGNFIYDDNKDLSYLKQENAKLKSDLELFQNGNKVLLEQGQGQFKNQPQLVGKKANWKVYQIDKWSKESDNKLLHQDKMIEITPEPSR